MDLEEWELLSDDGFFHDDDDGGGKKTSHPKNVFNMNYFICPSPPAEIPKIPNQLVPLPIQLEKAEDGDILLEKIKAHPPPSLVATLDGDQIFFNKMKENQFVDMKMDSPSRGIMLQIDPGKFPMEMMSVSPKIMRSGKKEMVIRPPPISPKKMSEKDNTTLMDSAIKKEEVNWEDNNIWKWSLTGFGALCSIGVAAATICIVIFGNNQRNKHQQNLRFQIYTDEKRINQVVHHATRLNETISAVRGVPLARAHITFGGYYDGL